MSSWRIEIWANAMSTPSAVVSAGITAFMRAARSLAACSSYASMLVMAKRVPALSYVLTSFSNISVSVMPSYERDALNMSW